MPYKNRTESRELRLLRSLNKRMDLPAVENQRYRSLKKGYEGEVQFDLLTSSLENKFYILNDLHLELNRSKFQIDTLIIAENMIILYEVKNYYGDYYYEKDNFHKCHNNKEITNPLHQINRSKTLLQQLLQQHGFHLPIEGQVIFINPEFFLYQAPKNEPIIYFTQLNRYLRHINIKPANLNIGHQQLAELLVNKHDRDPQFPKIDYKYDQVQKGFTCPNCYSFSIYIIGRTKIVCHDCGHHFTIENGVIQLVSEIRLLFPEKQITMNVMKEWCQSIIPERMIRRILKKQYQVKGIGQWTYYE